LYGLYLLNTPYKIKILQESLYWNKDKYSSVLFSD
jgi:hypothetical protein